MGSLCSMIQLNKQPKNQDIHTLFLLIQYFRDKFIEFHIWFRIFKSGALETANLLHHTWLDQGNQTECVHLSAWNCFCIYAILNFVLLMNHHHNITFKISERSLTIHSPMFHLHRVAVSKNHCKHDLLSVRPVKLNSCFGNWA